ncbi:gluconate:H+ symporter [Staphylococcus sp. ACRSN]|uniref:gluconate:H+ symporter n=1 Tax=Staphylococcus sp. ACRSN TaxID=2918214 RepID=UPI001EF2885A|nr:gluconate:H+ symporter [Staphylococcus sp. ACRSN]MCG7339247.1 gluconate:H+ symporter [Staphylococcus sp. ACRSN]
MPLITTSIGILILLILIMKFKINTFIALIIVAFFLALSLQIPPDKIADSIEKGLGDTLGHIGLIFGLGAMLGKLLSHAGGSHQIAVTLIDKFGVKKIQWAVIVASFIVGITLFYEVAFILLIPIIFTISREINISVLKLGFPMAATLLVTHSFLPPHPGVTAVALEYGANVGQVLLIGIIISIPTVIIGGVFYLKLLQKINPLLLNKPRNIYQLEDNSIPENIPSFISSLLTALFPVILMALGAITLAIKDFIGINNNIFFEFISFISNASVAILISLLLAIYTMGIKRKIAVSELMDVCTTGINTLGFLFLVIGGGGAIKQVLLDGGVGAYIAKIFEDSTINPIILAWIIAALLRVSLGSGTVATLSTAGLVIPIVSQTPDVNLALVTLATGAGSCILSHVNDAMFWMIKEYMGMTIKETFATYTVISTIISVAGLGFILILDIFM